MVDLTGLDIGDAIRAVDMKLPAGAELTAHDRDATVASIATSSAHAGRGSRDGRGRRRSRRTRPPPRTRRPRLRWPDEAAMLILAGLGNPGPEVRQEPPQHRLHGRDSDRARAGASAPSARASTAWPRRARSRRPDGPVQGADPASPQTYYNESGRAVAEAHAVLQARARRRGGVLRRDRPRARPLPHEDRRRRGRQQRRALDHRPDRPGLPPRPHRHRPSRATRTW